MKWSWLLVMMSTISWAALPPEHEVERLLLEVEKQVVLGDMARAEELLVRAERLQVELPLDYYYLRGRSRAESSPHEALDSLEQYIVLGGKEAPHYHDALSWFSRLEQELSVPVAETSSPPLPVPKPDSERLERLKQLYMEDDAANALVLHINSMFAVHPYLGTKLRRQGEKQGLEYQLEVKGPQLRIQIKAHTTEGTAISRDNLFVAGLDPYLRYGCMRSDNACWIYHPSQRQQRWLWLALDEEVTQELAASMSQLIRLMQRGSSP